MTRRETLAQENVVENITELEARTVIDALDGAISTAQQNDIVPTELIAARAIMLRVVP